MPKAFGGLSFRRHPSLSGKKKSVNAGNLVDYIMAHEVGELSNDDTLELYSYLVKTGRAWQLQGSYGRTASALIERGYLSKSGKILKRS